MREYAMFLWARALGSHKPRCAVCGKVLMDVMEMRLYVSETQAAALYPFSYVPICDKCYTSDPTAVKQAVRLMTETFGWADRVRKAYRLSMSKLFRCSGVDLTNIPSVCWIIRKLCGVEPRVVPYRISCLKKPIPWERFAEKSGAEMLWEFARLRAE